MFGSLAISPSFAQDVPGVIPGQYIVVLKTGEDPDKFSKAHGLKQLHKYDTVLTGLAIKASGSQVSDLKKDNRVLFIEPDLVVSATAQTLPTGIDRIEVDNNSIANINGGGPNFNGDVAVLDSGTDSDHPDLNVVALYTVFFGSTGDDLNGHGSHTAGTIAAMDNGFGVVGVAPGARIHSYQVLDQNGNGSISGIIAALNHVTANAATIEVVNMSLRAIGASDSFRLAVQNTVNAGVVVVVAAGNDSRDVYGPNGVIDSFFGDDVIPAAYPEAMTVSAMVDRDGTYGGTGPASVWGPDDSFASFSNFANNVDSSNPVITTGAAIDVICPGVSIYSTYKNGGYATFSGTSMASPHVAGLVLLKIAENGSKPQNAADVYSVRQNIIDDAIAQNDPKGLAVLNDPDSNKEPICWAEDGAVTEVNVAPVLDPINNQSGDELTQISFTATASDSNNPAQTLMFSLSGAPAGASINPSTGAFSWTPIESQGPGSYPFDVIVIDNGTPNLSDSETITITVNEVNVAPVLDPVGGKSVSDGELLSFTATASDPDIPANTLMFSLSGAPAGASINPSTGAFSWTPNGQGQFSFDVIVIDNGTPNLSDSETITITVNEPSSNEMHVESIDMSKKVKGKSGNSQVFTAVTIVDADGNPVSGAQITLNLKGTNNDDVTTIGVTGFNGIANFAYNNANYGITYTADVKNVTNGGWTYDSGSNVETSDSITI